MSDEKEQTVAEQIEGFAKLQFTDANIAQIMEMDEAELVAQYASAIDRGRLLAEAEVRTAMLKLAKEGNPTAMKQFLSMNSLAKRQSAANRKI